MRYEEMINGLADEMLEKMASEEEAELEKEAGLNFKTKKSAIKKVKDAMPSMTRFYDAKANKNMVQKELGGKKLDNFNPAMKAYKKERNKLVGGAAGVAAGAGAAAYGKNKVQEKAASYFEEAEFLKQAAEEAYQEAVMMQDAAIELYNRMEE